MTELRNRVTRKQPLPDTQGPVRLTRAERSRVHIIASLLLDYPDEAWFARLEAIELEVTICRGDDIRATGTVYR